MKYILISVLIVMGAGYSYVIKPSFDLNGGWENISYHSRIDNLTSIQLGTALPLGRFQYLGLIVRMGCSIQRNTEIAFLTAKIGYMEMISTEYVSFYFRENFFLKIAQACFAQNDLGLEVGFGIEIFHKSHFSPFVEGGFGYGFSNIFTRNIFIGGGIRYSWIK